MQSFPYQKIVVIGVTSSGKSTLANQLAKIIDADFIDLDSLHLEANWVEAPDDVFRERVEKALQASRWVLAGNYHVVRDAIWPKAQAIIWLDYPFHIVFWCLLVRTIKRSVTREVLFAGNVEIFWIHLKLWSEDSRYSKPTGAERRNTPNY